MATKKKSAIRYLSDDMRVGIIDIIMVGAKTKVKWIYLMYSGKDRIHTSEVKYDSKGCGSFMVNKKKYYFKNFITTE